MADAKSANLADLAHRAVEIARAKGAKESSATATRARDVAITWRDGKLEQLNEATTRSLGLELYVEGRYSTVVTSDLRPEALETFIGDAISMARALAPDPARALPEPARYAGQASVDLQLDDPAQASLQPDQRKRVAQELEATARAGDTKGAILSVTTEVSDAWFEVVRVASNGFEGKRRQTGFVISAGVSVKDADGRRPEDGFFAQARRLADLPSAASVGAEAGRRALGRLGQIKAKSAKMAVVIENKAVGRLLGGTIGSLTGGALQQKRSFFEGKLGQTIGSAKLNLADDPHVVRGLASRLWDGEGVATQRRPIFESGVLRTFFIDSYYGRKLNMAPTTGGTSNLVWVPGDKPLAGLIADAKDGVFVTGFLGGNTNGATGDFSMGIVGYRIANGRLAEPIGEMNMAGNYLQLWKQLAAVGNDPWVYSANRSPSLLLDGVSVAGA